MVTRAKDGIYKPKAHLSTRYPFECDSKIEPTCYSQAQKDPQWRSAMVDEFNASVRNHTWKLVPASPNMNVIGKKWVFLIKGKPDGSMD